MHYRLAAAAGVYPAGVDTAGIAELVDKAGAMLMQRLGSRKAGAAGSFPAAALSEAAQSGASPRIRPSGGDGGSGADTLGGACVAVPLLADCLLLRSAAAAGARQWSSARRCAAGAHVMLRALHGRGDAVADEALLRAVDAAYEEGAWEPSAAAALDILQRAQPRAEAAGAAGGCGGEGFCGSAAAVAAGTVEDGETLLALLAARAEAAAGKALLAVACGSTAGGLLGSQLLPCVAQRGRGIDDGGGGVRSRCEIEVEGEDGEARDEQEGGELTALEAARNHSLSAEAAMRSLPSVGATERAAAALSAARCEELLGSWRAALHAYQQLVPAEAGGCPVVSAGASSGGGVSAGASSGGGVSADASSGGGVSAGASSGGGVSAGASSGGG
eukprot:363465-Chlamydomonas_euryale.AAC.5